MASNLIDRDALPLKRYDKDVISWYATGWNDAIDAINRAPVVDAELVRHGQWINPHLNKYGHPCHQCNQCLFVASQKDRNYCPDCGAKMDKGVKT